MFNLQASQHFHCFRIYQLKRFSRFVRRFSQNTGSSGRQSSIQ
ncbi:hypothetical protein ABLN72_17925 [Mycobacterium tuberculosis]